MRQQDSQRTVVLAVDDSAFFREMLSSYLAETGYEAILAVDGAEALRILDEAVPDVVLVDLTMPDIDGLELCRRIRKDVLAKGVPILVLTSLDEPGIEVQAIDAGADDFITKPIDARVLDARIQMILRRMARERMASPLTGLPGNTAIDQEVTRRLDAGEDFCLSYADLDNFKAFNDRYGYAVGDELLRFASMVIVKAIKELGNKWDFVGHVGGDDFVYITTADRAEAVAARIIEEFDAGAPRLYDDETRQRGYFTGVDRRGLRYEVPLVTISIAMTDRRDREVKTSLEMADGLAELKRYAKSITGSSFVKERRHETGGEPGIGGATIDRGEGAGGTP